MNAVWVREFFVSGVRNLLRHKLRSALTLLGVFFGVAAVICMLGIGEGAQQSVMREISGLGLRNIIIESVQPDKVEVERSASENSRPQVFSYGVTHLDVEQIRQVLPRGARIEVAHRVRQKVYQRGNRVDADVLGVSPSYFDMFRSSLVEGRLLTGLDEVNRHKVALVPESRAYLLHDPMARSRIRIGDEFFTVVGVIRTIAPGGDRTVYIPYPTARAEYGEATIKREAGAIEFTKSEVGQVVIRVEDELQVDPVASLVDRTLARNHRANDYIATIPAEILAAKQKTQRILNLVLIVIAGISLLVGGIGIMNIMLAVVTERIREIGIRRALGATRNDILLQFMVETVTLSSLGGAAGCVVGILAVPLASLWTGWEGVVTTGAVVASLSVSWLVGLVFGIAPAIRAANLDPVEALRHE